MTETHRCSGCGTVLDGAGPGRCRACPVGTGVVGPDPGDPGEGPGVTTVDHGGVLDTVARTIGTIPRVLLRQTAPGEVPGPVVKPQGALKDASIRYRIDGEIARGGMGAVLKGRDPDLGRDVALKVLRDDFRGDPTMVRRFVEEAQIGGQLQHPGVVPIYELGTLADQRPFFSMKLVKGHTFAELLNARKSPLDEMPRSLSIFEAICQTMAYAHARGVIHRDLKPSNVMVGSFGEVQVMDWGLAKVLRRGGVADDAGARLAHGDTVIATARGDADAGLSQAGSILGTLAYMAPEQARGEVEDLDQRADVFALGSILCEILTGAPAYTGRSVGEVHRKAARGDLAGAVARLEAIEGDLAAICRDCLAPEREDRPADASAVAARITAHLAGVQERLRAAERDRAVAEAKAVEEGRRRRLQAGLAAASLVIVGLGGAGGLYIQRQRSERSAALDRQLGEAQTLLAQAGQSPENPAPWQKAIDAAARVQEPAGQDPASRQRLAAIRSEAEAGGDFARRIARLREALVDARSSQSDMSADEVDDIYAAAFRDAGLRIDELRPAELAALLKPLPPPVLAEIAAFLDDWSSYRQLRVPPAAWRTPIEAARAIDPDPFRDRLRVALLIADAAERAKALRSLAEAPEVGNLPAPTAVLLGWSLDGEDGIAVLRNAARRHPGDVWANYYLAEALKAKGRAGRAEALRFYTAARAIRPDTGHQLAHLLWDGRQLDEAEAVFRDLLHHRPQDHRSAGCFGSFLMDTGHPGEAAALLDRAIAGLQAECRKRPNAEAPWSTLATYLSKRGRLDEALAAHREVTRIDPNHVASYVEQAQILGSQGKQAEMVDICRAWLRRHPGDSQVHDYLGGTLSTMGRFDEAVEVLREAVRLNPESTVAHRNLALTLTRLGKGEAAVAEFRKAMQVTPGDSGLYDALGDTLKGLGREDEAVEVYRGWTRVAPDEPMPYVNLSACLECLGRYDEALAMMKKAHELGSKQGEWPHDSAGWLVHAQRAAVLGPRLPAVLQGEPVEDNADRVFLANLASLRRFPAAATRLRAQALAANPVLGESTDLRSEAARSAILAGTGKGKDSPPPSEEDRARFRAQGLAWLRAQLDSWSRLDLTQRRNRSRVEAALREWQQEGRESGSVNTPGDDLAGVRTAEALAKLPPPEQEQWRAFWRDVEALRKRAAGDHPERSP